MRTKPNNNIRLLPTGSGLLVTSPCKRPTQILDKPVMSHFMLCVCGTGCSLS